MPTDHDSIDLGHEDEIMEAFVAYDRLVRWEEHNSRLDATEPIVERAYARGRIVALVANLAAQALGVTSDDSETTTPNTEPDHDSIVEALRRYVRLAEAHHKEEAKLALAIRGIEASIPAVESLVAENARLRDALVGHHNATLQAKLSGRTVAEEWGRECDLSGCRALKGDD